MRATLEALFRKGLDAAHGGRAVERALRSRELDGDAWTVLACGKAAAAMAEAARAVLGRRMRGGQVCTVDGAARESAPLESVCAGHPLPDLRGERAANAALDMASALTGDDRLLVLLSGGASALWAAPVSGVPLRDKQRLNAQLLASGLDIASINAVRKHVSRIKGGGLARAAAPARILTLALSDVAGDAAGVIGSGPTAPDESRFEDALAALDRGGLRGEVPHAVTHHLEEGARGRRLETGKQSDPCFARAEFEVVARLATALDAIDACARAQGLKTRSLGRCLDADVADCARELLTQALAARDQGLDLLVFGGEPLVQVRGEGRGGRAQELALRFALAARDQELDFSALFAGSDGRDGATDAAGALVDGDSIDRLRATGVDPAESLTRNDSHTALAAVGDLLPNELTDTNVNDIGLIQLR